MKEELDAFNFLSVANIVRVLPIFDDVNSRIGPLHMEFMNRWQSYEKTLSQQQAFDLAKLLGRLYESLKNHMTNSTRDVIDLVIVAHGSISAPTGQELLPLPGLTQTSVIPASMHFATQHLSTISFYQPWGVLIDARAGLGIVQGTIAPSQTRFNGVGRLESIPNILPRFNVIHNGSYESLAMAWCNGINDNDPALRDLQNLINQHSPASLRPYIWWRLGSVPAFMVTAVASIAASMMIFEERIIDLNIHHMQCLDWPSRTAQPPAALATLQQYYNAVAETFRNPFYVTLA